MTTHHPVLVDSTELEQMPIDEAVGSLIKQAVEMNASDNIQSQPPPMVSEHKTSSFDR